MSPLSWASCAKLATLPVVTHSLVAQAQTFDNHSLRVCFWTFSGCFSANCVILIGVSLREVMNSNNSNSTALFACSRCFTRHPFEELSAGQQLCKVRGLASFLGHSLSKHSLTYFYFSRPWFITFEQFFLLDGSAKFHNSHFTVGFEIAPLCFGTFFETGVGIKMPIKIPCIDFNPFICIYVDRANENSRLCCRSVEVPSQ